MPFRIKVLLLAECAWAFGILINPYWGTLFVVVILFTRPQDDRPNMQQLHVPMAMFSALIISMFAHFPYRKVVPILSNTAPYFGLLVLMFISAFISGFTPPSQEAVMTMITTLITLVAVFTFISDANRLFAYLAVLLACGLYYVKLSLTSATFLRSSIEGTEYNRLQFRSLVNFGDPNYLSALMVLMIFLGLGMVAGGEKKLFRLPILASVLGYFYVFLKCQSRGASLGIAAGFIVYWLAQKRKIVNLVVCGLVLGVGVGFFAPAEYMVRLSTIVDFKNDKSATNRLALWGDALQVIKSHPLTGVGPNNFMDNFSFSSPHNTYLQIAAEVGIPALIAYIVLISCSFASLLKARRICSASRKNWGFMHSITSSLLACLVSLIVEGCFTGFGFREFVIIFIAMPKLCVVLAENYGPTVRVAEPAPFRGWHPMTQPGPATIRRR